jgi:nucleotide-binding universal stress UspA family protein
MMDTFQFGMDPRRCLDRKSLQISDLPRCGDAPLVDAFLPLRGGWYDRHDTPVCGGSNVVHLSRILAAVDFSSPARRAFDYALGLAVRHGAELAVVQAVPLDQSFNWAGQERLGLKADLRQMADAAGVPFTYRVQHGDPAEIILLHAQSVRPDVIVVGSDQRRGFDRWLVGSVGERVTAKATVPVLLVPARLRTPAVGPFRHVAVAVDLRAGSAGAVDRALTVASDTADRITLLHVVPAFSSGVPPHLYRHGVAEYQSQLVRDARRRLQLAVPAQRPSRAAIHTRVLRDDRAADINRVVKSLGADLLIVGVPRRGVVARALFGTTATRLLKAIDIPLLAVPGVGQSTGREEDVSRPAA